MQTLASRYETLNAIFVCNYHATFHTVFHLFVPTLLIFIPLLLAHFPFRFQSIIGTLLFLHIHCLHSSILFLVALILSLISSKSPRNKKKVLFIVVSIQIFVHFSCFPNTYYKSRIRIT